MRICVKVFRRAHRGCPENVGREHFDHVFNEMVGGPDRNRSASCRIGPAGLPDLLSLVGGGTAVSRPGMSRVELRGLPGPGGRCRVGREISRQRPTPVVPARTTGSATPTTTKTTPQRRRPSVATSTGTPWTGMLQPSPLRRDHGEITRGDENRRRIDDGAEITRGIVISVVNARRRRRRSWDEPHGKRDERYRPGCDYSGILGPRFPLCAVRCRPASVSRYRAV